MDNKLCCPLRCKFGCIYIGKQNDLSAVMHHDLMMDSVDERINKRIKVLKDIELDKARVARVYNKKIKSESFHVGDLVWKTILPLWTKSKKFGKWSPS